MKNRDSRSGSRICQSLERFFLFSKPKRSQHTIGLPFGIIFAIFLIIVFIVIAFIAVNHFLDIGECAEVGGFYDELQGEVNEAWISQSSDKSFEIDLPSGITRICFANLSAPVRGNGGVGGDYDEIKNYELYEANLFLIPLGKACNMAYKNIKHLDIEKMTRDKNPYCVDVSRDLRIKKDVYDKLVFVE